MDERLIEGLGRARWLLERYAHGDCVTSIDEAIERTTLFDELLKASRLALEEIESDTLYWGDSPACAALRAALEKIAS